MVVVVAGRGGLRLGRCQSRRAGRVGVRRLCRLRFRRLPRFAPTYASAVRSAYQFVLLGLFLSTRKGRRPWTARCAVGAVPACGYARLAQWG
jgi:hypothetical protein